MLRQLSDWFWDPKFWLPPGFDWNTFVEDKSVNYRVYEDLYVYTIPIALSFIAVRLILERTVFQALGNAFGIHNKPKTTVAANPYLEEHYKKKSPIDVVMKKTDLERSQVLQWLRKRKQLERPCPMTKLKDSCWRSTCYILLIIVGVLAVYDGPWIRDLNQCWINYPRHDITPAIWWHYMLSTGFYVSLLMTQTMDVKKKDSKQMCLHHLATLAALVFSWANNMIRMGTLVLLLHDIADPFLEIAKICRYIKCMAVCNFFFRAFAVVFMVTRLIIFPCYLLKSSCYDVIWILPWFNVYYAINGMLVILLFLHMFWAYLIYKTAVKAHKSGQVDDARSSSESSEEE